MPDRSRTPARFALALAAAALLAPALDSQAPAPPATVNQSIFSRKVIGESPMFVLYDDMSKISNIESIIIYMKSLPPFALSAHLTLPVGVLALTADIASSLLVVN